MTGLRWAQRYTISARFRLGSPLAIGAADDGGIVDLPVLLDGAGEPIVPGTSLAGVLRAAVEPALADARVRHWFGGAGDDDRASRVAVEDARLEGAVLELRDGVGIDRATGAAAPGIKYNRQVVAAGATFLVEVCVETEDPEGVPEVVPLLVGALDRGLALGAATTRGYGVAEPDEPVAVRRRRFTSFADTVEALRAAEEVRVDPSGPPRNVATFVLPWEPLTSVLVRAGVDGSAVDDLPLTTGQGAGQVSLVVPGSSVKGALRSHAEWIVRTVRGHTVAPVDGTSGDRFNGQLDVPLARELFGRPAVAPGGDDPSTTGVPGGIAAVTVRDLRSLDGTGRVRTISREHWDAIATARRRPPTDPAPPTEDLDRAVDAAGLAGELVPRTHVAIDRWTGAASDAALFSTLEVHVRSWEPIRLELDLDVLARRLPDLSHRQAAVCLLLLVLRDLADGLVPLGFGVNRGHGSVGADFTELTCTVTGPDAEDILGGVDLGSDEERGVLEEAWRQWMDEAAEAAL